MNFKKFSIIIALLTIELKVLSSPIKHHCHHCSRKGLRVADISSEESSLSEISDTEAEFDEQNTVGIIDSNFENGNIDNDLETTAVPVDSMSENDLPCDDIQSCIDWMKENKEILIKYNYVNITDEVLDYLLLQYQDEKNVEKLQQDFDAVDFGMKVDVNGRKMAVNILGEENKTTIVILPGLSCPSPVLFYNSLAELLADKFKIVIIEPFGYGISDLTDEERLTENIISEVHECLQKLGINQFYFMGHSIGGIYSLVYDNTYPNEVLGFIGLDNTPNNYTGNEVGNVYPKDFRPFVRIFDKYHLWGLLPEREMKEYTRTNLEQLFQNYPEEKFNQLMAINSYRYGNINYLDEDIHFAFNAYSANGLYFHCPLLMFVAEDSGSNELWRELHENMISNNPNKEIIDKSDVIYLNNTNHSLINVQAKDKISTEIKEWILTKIPMDSINDNEETTEFPTDVSNDNEDTTEFPTDVSDDNEDTTEFPTDVSNDNEDTTEFPTNSMSDDDLPCDDIQSCIDWMKENKEILIKYNYVNITDEVLDYLLLQYQDEKNVEKLQQDFDAVDFGMKVDVNGRKMAVNILGEENKTTIVILPGLSCPSPVLFYNSLAELLADKFKIVIIEPFGYGISDLTDEERLTENIISEVHECLQKLGINQFYFMGHSIGGIYSLVYDNTYPNEVLGFIGLDNTPNNYTGNEVGNVYPKDFRPFVRIFDKYHLWGLLPEREMKEYTRTNLEQLFQNYPEEKFNQLMAINSYRYGNINYLDEDIHFAFNAYSANGLYFHCPLLMFVAEDSGSNELWRELHENMISNNPNKEIIDKSDVIYLNNTNHSLINVQAKDKISTEIKEWILTKIPMDSINDNEETTEFPTDVSNDNEETTEFPTDVSNDNEETTEFPTDSISDDDLPCDNIQSCIIWMKDNMEILARAGSDLPEGIFDYLLLLSQDENKVEKIEQDFDAIDYGIKVDVNGHKMSVNIMGEEHNTTIVVLPGLGITSPVLYYKSLTEILAKDYKVVTVEPFSYGVSDLTDEERSAENIVSEIHECLQVLGIDQFYFMGHSLGGIYSLLYDNNYSNQVLGFIGLDNTPSNFDIDDYQRSSDDVLTFAKITDKYHLWGLLPESELRALTNIDFELQYIHYSEEEVDDLMTIHGNRHNNHNKLDEYNRMRDNIESTNGMYFHCPLLMFVAGDTGSNEIWVELHEDMINDNPDKEFICKNNDSNEELACKSKVIKYENTTHGFLHEQKKEDISNEIKKWIN